MSFLKEIKRDLVDPVKNFAQEVGSDTIGDAKRFYAAQAKNVQKNVKLAEQRAAEKREAIRREQEEMKKHRKAMMKRAAIIFAAIILISVAILSLILNHGLW